MSTISPEQFRAGAESADWAVVGDEAVATFKTGDFATGARFFAAVAIVAESANHHPDVEVRYSSVTVHLTTHSEGGLTDADAGVARRISDVAQALGIHAATPAR
ncbi:4a-hydroxytetrahydrobiopterin dehydratase [Agromyces seonyuensis]|uniref:Putative pterin-4-alpha-carbinolamine dehydratase n=1 Tax=Agromyces seonyuensis TaxID=2662446 RepID=A0A6I4P410_9MICO|nr:4a-hydroxytetrahydrobiopterin dehydratase [Agromyces seonyuensis]MWB98127.1 4a-hydroxytetrahydrobiopterin dehydratase [Agromyces seonyuensis]